MAEKESPESTEPEHPYLDVGPTGPRRWLLAIGALIVGLAIVAAFYGLYSINRSTSPTLTPDPLVLTQAASAGTLGPDPTSPSAVPIPATLTPTLTLTPVVTATVEPPTYTVQQGDTLIDIAYRLNVDVDTLQVLNQIRGETIYPDQILLVPPTVTPWPETGPFPHIISPGETLISIATLYQVTVDEIKALNSLVSDTIFVGQRILIPAGAIRPPTPTPTPEPWQPAIISGALDIAYPLKTIKGHFNLHIPPDTRAAANSETGKVVQLVESALDHTETVLQRPYTRRFEVYVADTLFEKPHTVRRGFSLPDENSLFLLYDGSGTPAERLYFATYALASLIASETLGEAASPLLSEGLAVYTGAQALESATAGGRRYLSPQEFCSAYQQTGNLPRVSRPLTLEGHLGHLDQHFAAGCFVGYLIEQDGISTFSQVYLSGDYPTVYGRTLSQLESDWIVSLRDAAADLSFDPEDLVRVASTVDDAYRHLWTDFEGTPAQFSAYQRLDRARLSLLQGRLGVAQEHLDALEGLPGDQ